MPLLDFVRGGGGQTKSREAVMYPGRGAYMASPGSGHPAIVRRSRKI